MVSGRFVSYNMASTFVSTAYFLGEFSHLSINEKIHALKWALILRLQALLLNNKLWRPDIYSPT
jgi:hypothetical protein